jgi:hypothetical protein
METKVNKLNKISLIGTFVLFFNFFGKYYSISNFLFSNTFITRIVEQSLLRIMTFLIENFDQKVPLLDISKKNHLNHFCQVVFDMMDLASGLFN